MDFHRLSRRELQSLCKRNKIPANITNVAMADALADLPSVDGMDEFLNGEGSGVPESPMNQEFIDSEVPRTASRTSTRRKTVKVESVATRARRAAAARCTEDSENRDLNVALATPSLPSGRRKAAAASSACKKVDFQMTVDVIEKKDNDLDQEKNVIEKTPAPKSQKKVAASSTRRRTETRNSGATEQRVYSTRRSVRLLEKNMKSLGLGEDEKIEPITVHMTFDDVPNSTGPVKEDTSLEVESKEIDESESKLDEDLKLGTDNQKNEQSEVQVSEVEPEIDLDSLNCSAASLITSKSDDSEMEAPANSLNVKCFPEVNEASKDDDAVKISADKIIVSDKFSLPSNDVDLTVVHNSSIEDESSKEMKQIEPISESVCVNEEDSEEIKLMNISTELSLPQEHVEEEILVEELLKESICELEVEPSESICESKCISEEDSEEEVEFLNISAEMSLPHEDVEEEILVDEVMLKSSELSLPHEEEKIQIGDVLSIVEESVMELKDDDLDFEEEKEEEEEALIEALNADIEGDEMKQVTISVQAEEEEDTASSMDFPEKVSKELVDEASKDINVDAIDSLPEIPNDDFEFEEEEEETLDADSEGEEMKQLTISVQTEEEEEEDTASSMDFPEKVSKELVDEAPKDINVDAIDSLPEIPNDDFEFEEEEEESLDADSEEEEMKQLTISVLTEEEEDTPSSMDFPEKVSKELVDEAPKDINFDAIDSLPKIPNDDLEFEEEEEALDDDSEGEEMKQLTIAVQAEEQDTAESMDFPEKVSEELVDEAPEDINVDVIDSLPEIPNDIVVVEEKALVEVSVTTSTEETIPTSSNIDIKINGVQFEEKTLASQFPRPAIETKSPLKDQIIQLLINNSDAEEDEEQEKANCIERQIVGENDKSLRQLRKIFKEQLKISKKKKKMDDNTKVVGGGKVRTALQPLPENRIMDELEKRS